MLADFFDGRLDVRLGQIERLVGFLNKTVGEHRPSTRQRTFGVGNAFPDFRIVGEAEKCDQLLVARGEIEVLPAEKAVDIVAQLPGSNRLFFLLDLRDGGGYGDNRMLEKL